MKHLKRRLDGIEAHLAGHSVTLAAEYKGKIDHYSLKQSYRRLCFKNPILMAQLRHEEGIYLFEVFPHGSPHIVSRSGDRNTLLKEADGEWSPYNELARLLHIEGDNHGYIALRADHSIVDAKALSKLLSELLEQYTAISRGDAVSEDEPWGTLPKSPSQLLASRWGTGNARLTYPPIPSVRVGEPELMEVIEKRISLSEEETARLITSARESDTTVNSVVSGAILLALKKMSQSSIEEEIICRSIIDLRKQVAPEVGATETTNFVAWHTSRITISSHDNLMNVGREVRANILNGIRNRDISLSAAAAVPELSSRAPERRLAMTSITNAGVITTPDMANSLEIASLFAARPKRLERAFFSRYAIHTMRRSLNVVGTFPSDIFNSKDATQVMDSISGLLRI